MYTVSPTGLTSCTLYGCFLGFRLLVVLDHPRSGVVYNFGRVCLSVCHTITFKSLDLRSSYLHMRHISTHYGSGHRSKNGQISLFPQCKTSIGNNSGSIKQSYGVCVQHGVFGYDGSNGDRHICHVTGMTTPARLTQCTHSQVVGLACFPALHCIQRGIRNRKAVRLSVRQAHEL